MKCEMLGKIMMMENFSPKKTHHNFQVPYDQMKQEKIGHSSKESNINTSKVGLQKL